MYLEASRATSQIRDFMRHKWFDSTTWDLTIGLWFFENFPHYYVYMIQQWKSSSKKWAVMILSKYFNTHWFGSEHSTLITIGAINGLQPILADYLQSSISMNVWINIRKFNKLHVLNILCGTQSKPIINIRWNENNSLSKFFIQMNSTENTFSTFFNSANGNGKLCHDAVLTRRIKTHSIRTLWLNIGVVFSVVISHAHWIRPWTFVVTK